eukprot:UN23584
MNVIVSCIIIAEKSLSLILGGLNHLLDYYFLEFFQSVKF